MGDPIKQLRSERIGWDLRRAEKDGCRVRVAQPNSPQPEPASFFGRVFDNTQARSKPSTSANLKGWKDWLELFDWLTNRNQVLSRFEHLEIPNRSTGEILRFVTEDLQKNHHLWLGYDEETGDPVLLSREILNEHAHIMGSTGSGKTAKGLIPLIEQLIRFRDSAVVIVDLKGDAALFQAARAAADATGAPFKWFTTEVGRSTFAFNPFDQGNDAYVSVGQMAENLIEALGLDHGDGYGASYFSRVNRRLLHSVFTQRERMGAGRLKSFRDLLRFLEKDWVAEKKERQDSFEMYAVVEILAGIDQLNVSAELPGFEEVAKNAIRMSEAIEKSQVLYFNLPQAIEGASSREIGRLVINALFRACYQHRRSELPGPKKRAYLVIDEFQNVVGKSFTNVLEQGRSLGLSIILAHQHLAQLYKGTDQDFRDVIKGTRFKRFFSIEMGSETHEYALKASGISLVELRKSSDDPADFGSRSESTMTRFTPNDLTRISDDPDLSIVHFRAGHGYTHFGGFPFTITSDFHVPLAEHQRRLALPWPRPDLRTLVSLAVSRIVDPPSKAKAAHDQRKERQAKNRALGKKGAAKPKAKTSEDPKQEKLSLDEAKRRLSKKP